MSQSRRRSSSPRRPSFVCPEQQKSYELCSSSHMQTTSPHQWKSEQVREYGRSLGVHEEGMVCRPCRQDASRVVANPSYTPRWEKHRRECKLQ